MLKRDEPAQISDAWHSEVSCSSSIIISAAIVSGRNAIGREGLRDREWLAGRDPQVESETHDKRKRELLTD